MSINQLNDDVLANIFSYLNFKDLLAAELCCTQWRRLITERRLYRQLSRQICKRTIKIGFSRQTYNKHLKEIRKTSFKLTRFKRKNR